MRDYYHFELYLNILAGDVYPQPPDPGHQKWLEEIIDKWLSKLTGLESVLDVGCGQGQAVRSLKQYAGRVEGVTLGSDAQVCRSKGLKVYQADFSFLPYRDGEFDLIFARHALEHSPMPLLTLMEWRRVARTWLLLVLPSLEHYGLHGQNHYYVLSCDQWAHLLDRAGWIPIWEDDSEPTEYRIMAEKRR
jgi:ubiquinone/menaquinone biosynthesis C-methylase UbiE